MGGGLGWGKPSMGALGRGGDESPFSNGPIEVPGAGREATNGAMHGIAQLLDTYACASGQAINFGKSSIVFSRNVVVTVQTSIAGILGIQWTEKHDLRAWWENLSEQYLAPFGVECGRRSVLGFAVGSGSSIRVWGSPWIPSPTSFRPITPIVVHEPNLLVSELMDDESGEWKVSRLREIFLPIDIEAILSIPLGRTLQPDLIVWHYTKDGRFSVRSAYHLACLLKERTSSSKETQPWSFLWTAVVPQKVRLFVWKAYKNALPPAWNLLHRVGPPLAGCPLGHPTPLANYVYNGYKDNHL
ncbi:UNVERIFIED_CONTAM: hypothetical protein Scaly_1376900 [Sesamum calycinum]|uniref:Reverse transcriptase zinc-binding domain-containing protein n=1 Tax=Sesamum calycinum TaxID=2727403 RepID=A0AAW2PL03_9LAMI